jgi:hypothetical protein
VRTKLVTFRTKSPKNGWTEVVCRTLDEDGSLAEERVINAFGGTADGRPEALRYCRLLNRAVDDFHRGVQ